MASIHCPSLDRLGCYAKARPGIVDRVEEKSSVGCTIILGLARTSVGYIWKGTGASLYQDCTLTWRCHIAWGHIVHDLPGRKGRRRQKNNRETSSILVNYLYCIDKVNSAEV